MPLGVATPDSLDSPVDQAPVVVAVLLLSKKAVDMSMSLVQLKL